MLWLILFLFIFATLSSHGTAQKDNNAADCDCYLTNGTTPAYFRYHTFDDFRDIDENLVAVPTVLKSDASNRRTEVASGFFLSDWWMSRWDIQSWNNSDTLGKGGTDASVLMVNSASNVYAGKLFVNPYRYYNK